MSADLGLDRSGNSNHWNVHNVVFADQVIDTPSNNFATLNLLEGASSATGTKAFSQGNLRVVCPVSGNGNTFSNIGVTSGKWYAEFYMEASTGAMRALVGVSSDPELTRQTNSNCGSLSGARDVGYMGNDGEKFLSNSESSYGTAFSNGDIIGCALDVDNDTVNFNNNGGSWKGTISIASDKTWHIGCGDVSGGYGETIVANFGQDSSFAGGKTAQGNQDNNSIGDFYYTPPSGFLALCTSNLPATITPSEHYASTRYTGSGGNKTISGLDFQPDLVIGGCLTANQNHHVHDAVRGVEKRIATNNNSAEETDGALKTFTSDGYTFDTAGAMNTSGEDYINYCWKANGSGSSNTNGSITSTVSANTAAGFSIVGWTGNGVDNSTIGHGLSSAPEIIITKKRSQTDSWATYHKDLTSGHEIFIDTTAGSADDNNNGTWGDNHPSSVGASTFAVGYAGDMNASGQTMIAYCFHSVDGYSKVGGYTGNGDNDGTFIYTGFRPAWIYIKSTNASADNPIFTSSVNPNNLVNTMLFMNKYDDLHTSSGNAEIDIVSNGFKHRYQGGWTNLGDRKFMFMAFADTPFKYANAR